MTAPLSQSPSPAGRHHLVISQLHHQFGNQPVLHDIGLSVAPGEVLCLAGPSGCGKSTLLRLIAGLESVQVGSIHIGGERVADAQRQRLPEERDIGLVFQDFALFPHLSVLDNVAFGLHKRPRRERSAQAEAMLERVGLASRARELPHVLSGGQQQRVALARALAPRPRLLLLDEPFSNLDVRLRHRLRADTLHLLKATGTTSIMVTHDSDEAMFMADRIALMQQGRIVQIGTPQQIYYHPQSPFAVEFFGDVNRWRGEVRGGQVQTPLGPLATPQLSEGSQASILIRPEAIQLSLGAAPEAVQAQVTEAHLLGATSLATLQVTQADGGPHQLQISLPGHLHPEPGSLVSVTLNHRGVFAFPAEADQPPE